MRIHVDPIALLASILLLWIGCGRCWNPEKFRLKWVEYYPRFRRLHEALFFGKWLFEHPRFHRGMIRVISGLFILMGGLLLFLSIFGDSLR